MEVSHQQKSANSTVQTRRVSHPALVAWMSPQPPELNRSAGWSLFTRSCRDDLYY